MKTEIIGNMKNGDLIVSLNGLSFNIHLDADRCNVYGISKPDDEIIQFVDRKNNKYKKQWHQMKKYINGQILLSSHF